MLIQWLIDKLSLMRWKASHPTNWYPDDSGEWVEVPDSRMTIPYALSQYDGLISILFKGARDVKFEGVPKEYPQNLDWDIEPDRDIRIVAYRKG